jgi:hypothetical protein
LKWTEEVNRLEEEDKLKSAQLVRLFDGGRRRTLLLRRLVLLARASRGRRSAVVEDAGDSCESEEGPRSV